ncbi:MAG: PilN domain-containing protein [Acidobacteria bacterium]|nr:PilN domain-containing protein [Acidobacteriota bacterium]MCA1649677.1 PilN domain-containing protein [Acidobacteriota bacterium]
MLRTNLSTRPFYNERAVHVALVAAAILVLVLTAFNIVRIVTLSRTNTELAAGVSRDRAEAARLSADAAQIRRGINQDQLELVVAAAQEANALIDQRTFSWTAFFNHLESTLPPDVMLSSIRPRVEDGVTTVTLVVLGRRAEDVDEFMEKLEGTGAFDEVSLLQQDTTDDGLRRATIEAVYTGTEPVPAGSPARGAQP